MAAYGRAIENGHIRVSSSAQGDRKRKQKKEKKKRLVPGDINESRIQTFCSETAENQNKLLKLDHFIFWAFTYYF